METTTAGFICNTCRNVNLKAFLGSLINEQEFESAYNAIDNFSLFCFYCECKTSAESPPKTKKKGQKTFMKTLPLSVLSKKIKYGDYLGSQKQVTIRDGRVVSPKSFIGALGTGKEFSLNIHTLDSKNGKVETFQEFAARAIAKNTKEGVTRMSEDTLKTTYKYIMSELLSQYQ